MSRAAKTEWQRQRRAEAALAAGREPHRSGRPQTGRQTAKHHGDRAAQRARARDRLLVKRGDAGWVETSHPIMDEAMAIARRYAKPDRGAVIFDPLYEEAICVAALAICAGEDPDEATRVYCRHERSWRYWRYRSLFLEEAE
jgi:hypothetical protein